MLDQLSYTESNGVWTKIITNTISDVSAEIAALTSQLNAFQVGQQTDPSDEVTAAIANYEQQISILEGSP